MTSNSPSPAQPSSARHFVLDQNFPQQIVQLAWPPWLRVSRLAAIEPRLTANFDDWQVLLALNQRGDVDGFITNDAAILYLAREMVVLQRTTLALIIADKVGHDAIRASGLLMTHLTLIARGLNGKPQIHVLRPALVKPQTPGQQLNVIAQHSNIPPAHLIRTERAAIGPLSRPVLPPWP